MQRRLALAFFIVVLALFVLIFVILGIVRNKGEDYSKTVLSQQNYNSTVIPFCRGTIMDRNQTVLAASEQVYNLILDPKVMNQGSEADIDATIQALVHVFPYDEEELRNIIETKSDKAYVPYEKELSKEKTIEFEEYVEEYNNTKNQKTKKAEGDDSISEESEEKGSVVGVWFEPQYKRVYPYDTLACTVLGFSGSDSSQGNWGIEQYYNEYLVGTNGREYGFLNSDGTVERTTKEAANGNTVITTLDFTIQKAAEQALEEFCGEVKADNVGILVMDPNNGEILAMASSSVYDLNDPTNTKYNLSGKVEEYLSEENESNALNALWRNFMISDTYEPGSTAKVFTEAAVLEEALADENSGYECDGGQTLAGKVHVRCSHVHHHVSFTEALAYSCNDAMMQMASKMGKSIFCKYQDLFGLGKKTGLDLPGEATGILHQEDDMSSVDLGTNSFGQNYTVTMVQMAAAYSSILNGGSYYQPHVVKEIISPDGNVVKTVGNNVVRETVSESTSQLIREGLQMCVEGDSGYCTGKKARISGYTVGGKTGTAEKYPRGNNEYLLSFIGFTPVENPQVLVYVIVDNPQSEEETYTAAIAVELEQKVMSSIVDYMNIPATAGLVSEEGDSDEADTPETDEDGNPIPSDDPEAIPEEGIISGDDGPPAASGEQRENRDSEEDSGNDDSENENSGNKDSGEDDPDSEE
ncbi:MAG: penicillin-binding transpeptidase domain-containing protein [Clostridiales bacterium]|nr:penicillin-binding transpeptidase domain-containing protein [Clostridiales bacterium]